MQIYAVYAGVCQSACNNEVMKLLGLVQAVESLSASCGQDLQGLNTHIHCPENGQTVDLSEGAASLRMVIILSRRSQH